MLAGYGFIVIIVHTYSWIPHSTHMVTYTHTHTLHTCCSCKWYFLGSLMCFFPLLLEKDQSLPKVPCLFEIGGSGAKFYWERRRVSQGRRKHFSFVWAKYSVGVIHLHGDSEAADDSTVYAKHALVRGLGDMHPRKTLEFREYIWYNSISHMLQYAGDTDVCRTDQTISQRWIKEHKHTA